MFIIDVTLKNTPVTLSVQRKSDEDAKALYQQVLEAMRSGHPATLELTCEQQTGKIVAILVNEISAVQVSEKSGAGSASGRPPGFFSLTAPAE
ncbi:MAG: hypothetical protein KME15_01690 [Drouetiella hepatica Uher 2000/2452]|jgi:hypothetical protein|uniref:UPF0367 protein KME15_01690 n=1 Tax=Drouetiella hepatica Uher 2000/2452 TaxID=904376 RepID=A0A951Q7M5_9CYAN|nr:hypothetical protein [Drouetiella hepatica Uher 2000/2452]